MANSENPFVQFTKTAKQIQQQESAQRQHDDRIYSSEGMSNTCYESSKQLVKALTCGYKSLEHPSTCARAIGFNIPPLNHEPGKLGDSAKTAIKISGSACCVFSVVASGALFCLGACSLAASEAAQAATSCISGAICLTVGCGTLRCAASRATPKESDSSPSQARYVIEAEAVSWEHVNGYITRQ